MRIIERIVGLGMLLAVLGTVLPSTATAEPDTLKGSGDQEKITYRGAPKNVKEFNVGGIDVILRPTGASNHVIAAKLFIKGGVTVLSESQSPAIEQLALLVPPLSGPSNMTKSDYRRKLDRMVTGIIPAAGRDFSTMTLRSIDENFDASWELFTGVIMRPKFDSTELRNVKEATSIGIRNRFSSPADYAQYLADSVFFEGHPYGRVAQESDISGLDARTLEDFYRGLFVKSRLLLVVVGNVDSADLHGKIAASLAKLPVGNYREVELPMPMNAMTSRLIIREPAGGREKVPTNYVVARYLAPNRSDSLYYPMLRLTSFMGGTLWREVRALRNLDYAPDADANFGKTSYGEITLATVLPDSAWRVAKSEAVDFFREYVITDESLKGGLNIWVTNNYAREQSNESQANEMGMAHLYTGSWSNAYRTLEALRDMTPDQLNRVAQLYLDNFTIVIVGNPSAITPSNYMPEPKSTGGEGLTPGSEE